MKKILVSFFALIICVSCVSANAQQGALGTDIPIMVMADDSDQDSIASNSSVSKYINTKIKEQFSRYNYYVVSQDALAASQGFDFNRRMDSASLLRAARMAKQSGQPEFDIRGIVIFKVYPRLKDLGFAKQINLEVAGEVHDADANRYIGDFGPVSRSFPAPADCDSACISAVTREKAVDIASIVADEARKKLALLTKGSTSSVGNAVSAPTGLVTTYAFKFENFQMPEVLKIRNVMERDFPDFVRAGRMTGSEPIVEYGYVSKAPQNKILEWVYIVLSDMKINDAKIIADGNSFVIKRLGSDLLSPSPSTSTGKFR